MAIRIGRLADSSLVARKLAPMRLVVCASPGYLAAHGTPERVADLAGQDCLGHTGVSGSGSTHWAFGPDGGVKVPVRSALHADNGEALVRAAVAGQGLVYGPRFIAAEDLAKGALVEVALDASPMDLGAAYALTHPSRRPAAKTRAWIDHLTQRLPPLAASW